MCTYCHTSYQHLAVLDFAVYLIYIDLCTLCFFRIALSGTYAGQPSNVDTVNRAIMAMSTLSKLKSLLCH